MPLFDLRCNDCSEEFEELLSSSKEIDEVECPNCGAKDLSRLMSGFAVTGGVGGLGGASSGCSNSSPFG